MWFWAFANPLVAHYSLLRKLHNCNKLLPNPRKPKTTPKLCYIISHYVSIPANTAGYCIISLLCKIAAQPTRPPEIGTVFSLFFEDAMRFHNNFFTEYCNLITEHYSGILKNQICPQEYRFLFASNIMVIDFTKNRCLCHFITKEFNTFGFPTFDTLRASAFHKINQKHPDKQIKNDTLVSLLPMH